MNTEVSGRLTQLPAFHPTALKLLTVSTESLTAIEDFEACFKADPALAAELLQTANSAEFGLRAEVESIRQAMMLMGLERVSSLSFTVAMKFYMRNSPRRQVMHPVWSHSVASGMIAEILGQVFRNPLKGLYTAGLMHDVGRLGLLMSEGNKYEIVLTQLHETMAAAAASEQLSVGTTHPEAGAVMAEHWGIPPNVCECIRHHHADAAPSESRRLLDLVCVACRLASALGYPEVSCSEREDVATVMESVPAPFRNNPLLEPDSLTGRIKKVLGSVW